MDTAMSRMGWVAKGLALRMMMSSRSASSSEPSGTPSCGDTKPSAQSSTGCQYSCDTIPGEIKVLAQQVEVASFSSTLSCQRQPKTQCKRYNT